MALEFKTSGCLVKLYVDQIPLRAEVEDSEKQVAVFTDREITYGVLGKLPLQALVEKVKKVGLEKIHVVVYQNPKELGFFEAEKTAAPLIKKGKEHLREDSEDRFGMYEKALNMLGQALKIQQKTQGAVEDLKGAIFHLTGKLNVLKCQQGADLCLAVQEVRALKEVVEIYQDEESIFETMQMFLEVQDPLEPHHYFLQAVIHEARGEYIKALEGYLVLSENAVRAHVCLEKAYQLLNFAIETDPTLQTQQDGIRKAFEDHLRKIDTLSPSKNPTCFVCFSTTHQEICHWIEKNLVPDMDLAGVKPIASFIDTGTFRDNFHTQASSADTALIVCTPEFKAEYEERKKAPVESAQEIKIIQKRLGNEETAKTIFLIYLNGNLAETLPTDSFAQLFATKFGSLSHESFGFNYFSHTFDLLGAIRRLPKEAVRAIQEDFLNDVRKILNGDLNRAEILAWKQAQETRRKNLYEAIADRIATNTQSINIPPPDNLFTGRVNELAKLKERCRHRGKVVISGLGGIGKTTLARKYAHDDRAYYQLVHFVSCLTPGSIVSDLLSLADILKIPPLEKIDERLQMLKRRLEQLEYDYLLVFDSVDSPDSYDELQKHLPIRGSVLITSRLQEEWNRLGFEPIPLGLFSEGEALEFLTKSIVPVSDPNSKQLALMLDYLPLALTHAASYIRTTKCTILKYLDLFKQYEGKLFEAKNLRLTINERTVLTTWQISMDVIEKQEGAVFARPLMNFISFLAPSNIPEEALELWSQNSSFDELEFIRTLGLLQNYSLMNQSSRSWNIKGPLTGKSKQEAGLSQGLSQMSPKDKVMAFQSDEPVIEETLWKCPESIVSDEVEALESEPLQSKEIIRGQSPALISSPLYEVHPLVQMAIRYGLSGEVKQGFLDEGVKVFNKMRDKYDYERLENREQTSGIVLHLGMLIEHFDRYICNEHTNQFVEMLMYLWGYNRYFGRFEQGKDYAERSLNLTKAMYPDMQHELVVVSLNNIGASLRDLGRHEEALKYKLESLEQRKKLLGPEHPYVATSLNNIGASLRDLGRHEEALQYMLEALEQRKKLLRPEHPHVATSLNNIGVSLGELGRHEEALKYKFEALEQRKKLLGPEHPHVAASLNNIGSSLGELGRHEEALKYKLEALELRKKLLGPEHPHVATSLNNVGSSLGELGRYEEALKYKLEALELRKKLLGPEHPDVATSLDNVGGSLGDLGRHEEALQYMLEALELRKKLLGPEHPDVATSLNNVGGTLGSLEQHKEALDHLRQALELRKKLLGPEHPDVATSLNNIGLSFGRLGRHEEALKYQMESLQQRKKLLGPEHPNVATSLNNVGSTLRVLGRHEEALGYLSQAFELLKKALGPTHPKVMILFQNVLVTLMTLGQEKKIRALKEENSTLNARLTHSLQNKFPSQEQNETKTSERISHSEREFPTQSLRLDPTSSNNKGVQLINLGRFFEALDFFNQALKLQKQLLPKNHPDLAISLFAISCTQASLYNYPKALQSLKEALQIASTNSDLSMVIKYNSALQKLKRLGISEAKQLITLTTDYQKTGQKQEMLGVYSTLIPLLQEIYDEKFSHLIAESLSKSFVRSHQ